MSTLGSLAKLIRSKNAGPFQLTIDIIFDELSVYEKVLASGVINEAAIATLLGVEQRSVRIFEYLPAFAIKVTVPRRISVGDPADTDLFGGQLFGPLVDVVVP